MKNWFRDSGIYWRHLIPPILWGMLMIAIFGLQFDSFPGRKIAGIIKPSQLAHLIVFAVFVILLATGFKKQYNSPFLRIHGVKLAIATGMIYGTILEFLQLTLFESRSFDIADILLNITGCLLGILVFYFIYRDAVTMG